MLTVCAGAVLFRVGQLERLERVELWTAAAGLHNAHRVGATISPSVKAAYLYQPGASMWSYNVAGSRSWAPVAGAPRPAAPTGSPIGAELSDANHSISR